MNSENLPGLYLHIPFCRGKCAYCGFYSRTDLSLIPDFLKSLRAEMTLYREAFSRIDTVYLGGGTPSILGASHLEVILDAVRRQFVIADDAEITVELNPGDLTARALRTLRALGVNRLTLGCQSFDDAVLAFLGRRHSAGQCRDAILAVRAAGFDDLGLDLIYGLPAPGGDPGTAFRGWLASLQTALSFQPEHLSCYQLTLEADTPLAATLALSPLSLPDDDLSARYFLTTSERLEAAGYRHYEVSNFTCDDDHRARHNRKYWDHTPYLGLGPSAHSFDGTRRWWNPRDFDAWVGALRDGMRPIAGEEILTLDQLRLEALFLGLRTREGIDMEAYRKRYGFDLCAERGDKIAQLAAAGLVRADGYRFSPTRRGLVCADFLARFLS